MAKNATLEPQSELDAEGSADEYITLDDHEEALLSSAEDVDHGDFGLGPVPIEQTHEGRRRRMPKDWKFKRRPPAGHKGNVKKGDLVTFVNLPQPRYLRGEDKGKPKETDPPWQPQMYAIINRVVDPDKHIVDLRVLFEGEDDTNIIRDMVGVQYDAGTKKGTKTVFKFRSWH